jgi:2-haloacid dehalogenase
MANRPSAVAFDVVETLMPLEPLAARLERAGLPGLVLREWFTRLLLYGVALSAAGDYVRFPEVAAEALRAVSGYRLAGQDVEYVLAGFAELPAHPDAEPAMRRLAGAGVRVCCLTNGSADITAAFLARTGLQPYVERVISVAEVGSWKPPARVYQHAADVLGLPPERVALVAVHAWDCHGAKRAGLTTAWASRLEGRYGGLFAPADVTGADLAEVADALLALPVRD